MDFKSNKLTSHVEGGHYEVNFIKSSDGWRATFHQDITDQIACCCSSDDDEVCWMWGTCVNWKVFSTYDEAIRECERFQRLREVPEQLSWKDVFYWRSVCGDLSITMEKVDDTALKNGYPYFLWNDRVYITNTRIDTGKTIDDIR